MDLLVIFEYYELMRNQREAMEESKFVQSWSANAVPPFSPQQNGISHSQSTPVSPRNNNNAKRKLSPDADFHRSSFFKIRSLVRDLRPHFIELLRTADFRNCNAAYEIKKQMKVVMDLHKLITLESDPPQNFVSECEQLSGKSSTGKEPCDNHHEGQQAKVFQDTEFVEISTDKKPSPTPSHSENKLDDAQRQGRSYVIGGSVFGWNFVTFGGKKPGYYGVTKASYQSSQKK